MAIETFNWRVTDELSVDESYSIRETQFGDGYVQRSGEGVNNIRGDYSITVVGKKEELLVIRAFFKRHGGWKSFFWTNPFGEIGLYVCQNPSMSPLGGDKWKISGTFIKSYAA